MEILLQLEKVKIIEVLCDPVKRLRSDLKHCQEGFAKFLDPNSKFPSSWAREIAGVNGQVWPVRNLTLEKYVRIFLPRRVKNKFLKKMLLV